MIFGPEPTQWPQPFPPQSEQTVGIVLGALVVLNGWPIAALTLGALNGGMFRALLPRWVESSNRDSLIPVIVLAHSLGHEEAQMVGTAAVVRFGDFAEPLPQVRGDVGVHARCRGTHVISPLL